MAIYHLAAQVISRGAGRNAVNAAAYRRGARMHDERTGETFSYVHKRDVLHSEIAIPDDAPSWAKAILERHALEPVAASEELWNRVESHEKRLDAQLAREIEIALPAELSFEPIAKRWRFEGRAAALPPEVAEVCQLWGF